ncbi:MAG: PQQ-dependent sugar dehydrogenase [Gammaproteobacteria bacterium]
MSAHSHSVKTVLQILIAFLLSMVPSLPCVEAQEAEQTVAINPMQVDPHEYVKKISLPKGFSISIYADQVTGARSMAQSPNGTLFVGTFTEWGKPPYGKVYAIIDQDNDHKADEVITVAEGLNHSNGVALRDGNLYVSELNRILRYDDIEINLRKPPAPVVINDSYPTEFHHGWKFIRFGPDGRLYVPVGAPCNMCEPKEPHSTITSMKPDGTDLQIFARGIRNSVGFDWDPQTRELWFTDNGRDGWGNERPPEELNHAPRAGLHFGFPYRYGNNIEDTTFKTTMKDADFTPAAIELPAHRAGLGMRFYTGKSFPAEYRNQIFIAHHGSWNRSPPDGYRVSLVRLKDGNPAGYEDFATGWLIDEKFWGRPVDVEIAADGSLFVSDDFAHVIYRISYGG